MANKTELRIKEALELHNLWIGGETGGEPLYLCDKDLSGFDFSDMDLSGADFSGSNLSGANFADATLREVSFDKADLREAYFADADLRMAVFREADLRNANFTDANMREADLSWANLDDATLRGADLHWAELIATGNSKELRTMQICDWRIGYTHDILQIGWIRKRISDWHKPESRELASSLGDGAEEWVARSLDLVLALVAANPADK